MEELKSEQIKMLDELAETGNSLQNTSNRLEEGQKVKLNQIEQSVNKKFESLHSDLLTDTDELIRNLTDLETSLAERNKAKLSEMTAVKNEMNILAEQLKEDQKVKLENFEITGNVIKVEIQERMLKLEDADRQQTEEYTKILQEFREAVNNTWQEVRTEGFHLKPAVVFHYQNVIDTTLYIGETVVFANELLDTASAYNTSSGLFTAPVKGTYMFSVQMCGLMQKETSFRIYAEDKMLTDSSMYDYDSDRTCVSSNAIAILAKGDFVSVRTGPNGLTVNSQDGTRSAFMGILVQ